MSLMGPGTAVVAGQRFPLETRAAWAPVAYGPSAQVAPLPQMSIPPVIGSLGSMAPSSGGADSYAGTGAANLGAAAAATAAPFSLKLSPVLWAVAFLVIGLVGLRVIHWR